MSPLRWDLKQLGSRKTTDFGLRCDSLDYSKKTKLTHRLDRLGRHGLVRRKRPPENREKNLRAE